MLKRHNYFTFLQLHMGLWDCGNWSFFFLIEEDGYNPIRDIQKELPSL